MIKQEYEYSFLVNKSLLSTTKTTQYIEIIIYLQKLSLEEIFNLLLKIYFQVLSFDL